MSEDYIPSADNSLARIAINLERLAIVNEARFEREQEPASADIDRLADCLYIASIGFTLDGRSPQQRMADLLRQYLTRRSA